MPLETVAVINSTPDIVDIIRIALEQAGVVVVSALTHEIRQGAIDLEHFVSQHEPRVIVYDIAPPYEANWLLFQHICSMPELRDRHFIITTTNERHVRALAGSSQRIFEIVGKPYDLGLLTEAVKEALRSKSTR